MIVLMAIGITSAHEPRSLRDGCSLKTSAICVKPFESKNEISKFFKNLLKKA